MGKPPHFQPARPSHLPAHAQAGRQNQPHAAVQPKTAAPPVYWPQPTSQALQRKVAGGAQPSPAAPSIFSPHQAPKVLQARPSPPPSPQVGQAPPRAAAPAAVGAQPTTVQMRCNCGKPGNRHRSNCPASKQQKRAKNKKDKVVHQESQSIRNLYAYDSNWANQQGITEKMVKDFVKSYRSPIHGHASSRGDTGAKRHANTTTDINAFHSWYNQNSGNY